MVLSKLLLSGVKVQFNQLPDNLSTSAQINKNQKKMNSDLFVLIGVDKLTKKGQFPVWSLKVEGSCEFTPTSCVFNEPESCHKRCGLIR